MRSNNFPVLLLAWSALFLFACGSSDSETATSTNTNSKPIATDNASSNGVSTGNSNTQSENINRNGNFAVSPQMQRIQEMRANANRPGAPNIQSMNARPAPEDSTISTTLTDVAREVRTWRKDTVLAKVEKTYDGGDGSIKVYLRNGKVIALPGKSIPQLSEIPAATVLSLAGVTVAATKAKPGQNPRVKKADN